MAVNKKSPICRITNILYLLFANFQCPCPRCQKNFAAPTARPFFPARRRAFCGKRTGSYPQLWITLSANVDIPPITGLFARWPNGRYPQGVDRLCGFVDNPPRKAPRPCPLAPPSRPMLPGAISAQNSRFF